MVALQYLVYFVVFLGVLVTVHETGHFLAAKWAGVKVLKFSIGFGPKLLGFRRGDTEYQVALLPLGGFVAMAGQNPGDEVDEADAAHTLLGAPWWKRMFILSAGPAFNLIFPFFAYFVADLGWHQALAPRVGSLEPGYPAAEAGLRPGDVITRIDGRPIRAFEEIGPSLDGVFDRPVAITVQRDGAELTVPVTPKKGISVVQGERRSRGFLGFVPVSWPVVIGAPEGSRARAAGLATFDRLLTVGGQRVADESELAQVLKGLSGRVEVVAARSQLAPAGGVTVVVPQLVKVELEKGPGVGLAALGAEPVGLYAWAVLPGSPAEKAGVEHGDRLVAVNGVEVSSWAALTQAIQAAEGKQLELAWRTPEGSARTASIDVPQAETAEALFLGLRQAVDLGNGEALARAADPVMVTLYTGPWEAVVSAAREVPETIRRTAVLITQVFDHLDGVGGPILLAQIAVASAEDGYRTYLKTMAIVSVNLALVNLLPIPVLDGFGLLAAAWEGIRRRPIPARAREIATIIGLVMLVLLFVLANKNDITRLLR